MQTSSKSSGCMDILDRASASTYPLVSSRVEFGRADDSLASGLVSHLFDGVHLYGWLVGCLLLMFGLQGNSSIQLPKENFTDNKRIQIGCDVLAYVVVHQTCDDRVQVHGSYLSTTDDSCDATMTR